MNTVIEILVYVTGSLCLISIMLWVSVKCIGYIFKTLGMYPQLIKAIYRVVQERRAVTKDVKE